VKLRKRALWETGGPIRMFFVRHMPFLWSIKYAPDQCRRWICRRLLRAVVYLQSGNCQMQFTKAELGRLPRHTDPASRPLSDDVLLIMGVVATQQGIAPYVLTMVGTLMRFQPLPESASTLLAPDGRASS
jgi:hypothetical protein